MVLVLGQESCYFLFIFFIQPGRRPANYPASDVMGLWPEVHVLRVPCAAARRLEHPPRQGGPVRAGDGPEAGQGWMPLPAAPQQRPREDE